MSKFGAVILLAVFFCVDFIQAQDEGIVVFPYKETPCKGKLLGAVCCQGVRVVPIDFNKTLCVDFQLKLFPPKADVKIKLDNSTVADFTIDPKNPPTYCIPVIVPVPVAMCLRLHDIKMIGLAFQVCSTLFVSYDNSQVFQQELPCVKLSGDGIKIMGS